MSKSSATRLRTFSRVSAAATNCDWGWVATCGTMPPPARPSPTTPNPRRPWSVIPLSSDVFGVRLCDEEGAGAGVLAEAASRYAHPFFVRCEQPIEVLLG